jgi:hypothetical protein
MKQSEPANPRSVITQRNAAGMQGSAVAAEISGYVDIGMKKEALRLTRKVLEKRRIHPEEFSEVIRTMGICLSSKAWKGCKPKIEAAYNRQSRKVKRKVRPNMIEMYASLGDWETAVQLLSIQRCSSASELFFGVGVLLKLDRLEDARVLAIRCAKALPFATSRFEQSLLLDALADFFARTHSWDHAITAWQDAPLEEPFRGNALSGIVKIHLARAFESIEIGLRKLAELKENVDNENELCLPGNDLALTLKTEKELLKFKRGIEKLLPQKVRKELGIDITTGTTRDT